MKHKTNRLLTLLMAVIMVMAFSIFVNAEVELAEDYTGKTVILSSNDVHGAVDGYAYMKALEKELKARGADVITVDAGDFSNGDIYVSESKGRSAIEMMNLVGYDYSTLGNHEFDFGPAPLKANIDAADFKILCADIFNKDDGASSFTPSDIYEDEESGLKIGFFGMATPETQTKALPSNFEKIEFPSRDDIYPLAQGVVDQLKADGADVIVCLAHLGVDPESEPYRSYDFFSAVEGIDIVLDGHSHTVMEKGDSNEPIMSTGTKFMNIGVTVIDEESKEIESNGLYHLRDSADDLYTDALEPDADVKAVSDALIAQVDEAYGAKFAESEVNLNGARTIDANGVYGNRDGETNMGDLITDAIKWYIMKDGTDLGVPDKNVVTITNGGGIRAAINIGDVSKKDVLAVLPFGNTIAAVTVTGSELLEALEASTYCSPTSIGGYPQIEGMNISINQYAEYDANAETYPESTYYGPASINRVEIKDVNGEAFDPDATYVVLTNNFCAEGGDTYYVFKNASASFDTGITMEIAVQDYIVDSLEGVIDETYAEPKGRITYLTAEEGNTYLKEKLDNAKEALEEAQKVIDSKDATIAEKEAAIAKANEAIAQVQSDTSGQLAALQAKLDEANKTIEALKNQPKAEQPMKVKGKTVKAKASSVKKKALKISAKKAITVSDNQGSVTFKKASGNKKITVAKNGKITVKKGLKKGTYKVKIKVTAAGNDNYLAGSKTVTVTIKVK